MKIIGEVFKLPSGSLLPQLYCVREGGQVDRAVTDTLLDLIQQSYPHEDQLEALVVEAEAGRYTSPDPSLPDWGVNDTNIWLVVPMAQPGCMCIANENSSHYSSNRGEPQQFTYEQFYFALKHWREFKQLMAREGKAGLVGRRYEATLPG
jgi:hypothetical protein